MTVAEIACAGCGRGFVQKRGGRFCSTQCSMKDYHRRHRDERLAIEKQRYIDNREKILARVASYRSENREDIRKKTKEKYHSDEEFRTKKIQSSRKYHADNRSSVLERAKERRLAKPHSEKIFQIRSCQGCGTEFRQKSGSQIHCSYECRGKKYYRKNRDKFVRYSQKSYHKHKEKREAHFQQTRHTSPWAVPISSEKSRARIKGREFSLTREWGRLRWTGVCEVTGIPFIIGRRGKGPHPLSPSIDRIDQSQGYLPDNCRFVVWAVNLIKHIGTDDEMILIVTRIAESGATTLVSRKDLASYPVGLLQNIGG